MRPINLFVVGRVVPQGFEFRPADEAEIPPRRRVSDLQVTLVGAFGGESLLAAGTFQLQVRVVRLAQVTSSVLQGVQDTASCGPARAQGSCREAEVAPLPHVREAVPGLTDCFDTKIRNCHHD